nr:hypothetical protein [Tanacetum cinerariifolium]
MSITGVLGRGWRIPTDWPRVNPRNNGKDSLDQAMQATQDRQKNYVDRKWKLMEFKIGDRVMLKVSPWKGVVRFVTSGLDSAFDLDDLLGGFMNYCRTSNT